MGMQSDLARVRHLGSAKEGTHHWWGQRLTAIALVPLSLWFIWQAISLGGLDWVAYKAWISHPANTLLMVMFVIAVFHHMQLGLQVVVEDYVHGEGAKITLLVLNKLLAVLLGGSCILSILKVAFGG